MVANNGKRGRLDSTQDLEGAKRVKIAEEYSETLEIQMLSAGEVTGATTRATEGAAPAAPTAPTAPVLSQQGPWDRFNSLVFVAEAMNTDGSNLTACFGLDGLRNESPGRVAECLANLQAERNTELVAEQWELSPGLQNLSVLRRAPATHVTGFQQDLSGDHEDLQLMADSLGGLQGAPARRMARCRQELRDEEEGFLRAHTGGGSAPAAAAATAVASREAAAPAEAFGEAARTMGAEVSDRGAAGVKEKSMWTEEFLEEQRAAFEVAGQQWRQDLKEFRALIEGPGAAAHEKLAKDMAAAAAGEEEFLAAQEVLVENVQQWQRQEFVNAYGGATVKPMLVEALDRQMGVKGGGAKGTVAGGDEGIGLVGGPPRIIVKEKTEEEEGQEQGHRGQEVGRSGGGGKRKVRFSAHGDSSSDTSSMGATDDDTSDLSPVRKVKGKGSIIPSNADRGKRKRRGEEENEATEDYSTFCLQAKRVKQ